MKLQQPSPWNQSLTKCFFTRWLTSTLLWHHTIGSPDLHEDTKEHTKHRQMFRGGKGGLENRFVSAKHARAVHTTLLDLGLTPHRAPTVVAISPTKSTCLTFCTTFSRSSSPLSTGCARTTRFWRDPGVRRTVWARPAGARHLVSGGSQSKVWSSRYWLVVGL